MDDDDAVGRQVRARREALGMTQESLARRLGVHQQTIHKIEKGLRSVRLAEIVPLVAALECGLEDFLADGPVVPLSSEVIAERIVALSQLLLERMAEQK